MKKFILIPILLFAINCLAQTTVETGAVLQTTNQVYIKNQTDSLGARIYWYFGAGKYSFRIPKWQDLDQFRNTFNNGLTKTGNIVTLGGAFTTDRTLTSNNNSQFTVVVQDGTGNNGDIGVKGDFSAIYTSDNNSNTYGIQSTPTNSVIGRISLNKFQALRFKNGEIVFVDSVSSKGPVAAGNYEGNYTSKSYTSKRFVDSANANNVKLTGDQTINGDKSFNNSIFLSSGASYLRSSHQNHGGMAFWDGLGLLNENANFRSGSGGIVYATDNGSTAGNSAALIAMNSTTRGFLMPSMTQAQRLAIVLTGIEYEPTGLKVYQTDGAYGNWTYHGPSLGWIRDLTAADTVTGGQGITKNGHAIDLGGTFDQNVILQSTNGSIFGSISTDISGNQGSIGAGPTTSAVTATDPSGTTFGFQATPFAAYVGRIASAGNQYQQIGFTGTEIIVTDALNLKGATYKANYFTAGSADDRWIPDWGAVKSLDVNNLKLTGKTAQTIAGNVTIDNTTGATEQALTIGTFNVAPGFQRVVLNNDFRVDVGNGIQVLNGNRISFFNSINTDNPFWITKNGNDLQVNNTTSQILFTQDSNIKDGAGNFFLKGTNINTAAQLQQGKKDRLNNQTHTNLYTADLTTISADFTNPGAWTTTTGGITPVSTGIANYIMLNKEYSLNKRYSEITVTMNSGTQFLETTRNIEGITNLGTAILFDAANNVINIYHDYDNTVGTLPAVAVTKPYTFVSGRDYTIKMVRDQFTNKAIITDNLTFISDTLSEPNRISGRQYDAYAFSVLSGSMPVVKSIQINTPYKKNLDMLYMGDSISDGIYINISGNYGGPLLASDTSLRFTQMGMNAFQNQAALSARGGGNIDGVIAKILNELAILMPKAVNITIGTNSGNTLAKLATMVSSIQALGIKVFLNKIPLRSDASVASRNADIATTWGIYGITGADFAKATSINNDGSTIDTTLFFSEVSSGVRLHPKKEGMLAMFNANKGVSGLYDNLYGAPSMSLSYGPNDISQTYQGDLNLLTGTKAVTTGNSATNKPGASNYHVQQYQATATIKNQFAQRINTAVELYYRYNNGTSWSGWVSLFTSASSTILSSALATAISDETGNGASVFAGSPNLTGIPTAPTASAANNSTQLSTTAYSDRVKIDNVLTKTANYTILSTDWVAGKTNILRIFVDATAGNVTITLPTAVSFIGYAVYVTKTDASVNTVTISPALTLSTLVAQGDSKNLSPSGTTWYNQ